MAQLLPKMQQFVDLRDGTIVGIHVVTVQSSSDYFYVPKLAYRSSNNVCSNMLYRPDGNNATITDNAATANTSAYGGNVVTISSGTAGQDLLIVTSHGPNVLNFGDED